MVFRYYESVSRYGIYLGVLIAAMYPSLLVSECASTLYVQCKFKMECYSLLCTVVLLLSLLELELRVLSERILPKTY